MIRWAQWKQQRVVNSVFRKSPLKSLKCNNPLQDKGVPRLDVQLTPHQTSQPLAHVPVSCRRCAQPLRAPKPREGGPCSRPCFPSGCLRIALPSCCLGRAPSSGPAGGAAPGDLQHPGPRSSDRAPWWSRWPRLLCTHTCAASGARNLCIVTFHFTRVSQKVLLRIYNCY